jgi:hypothetical protein
MVSRSLLIGGLRQSLYLEGLGEALPPRNRFFGGLSSHFAA